MRPLVSYFEDGKEAYFEEVKTEKCPYPEKTVRQLQWLAGWNTAFANDPMLDTLYPDAEEAQARAWAQADMLKWQAKNKIKAIAALLPNIASVEKAIGPVSEWSGNCYGVADALLKSGLLDKLVSEEGPIKLCYGVYSGEVATGSIFSNRSTTSRHGWLELDQGVVIDPTRWVFEASEPNIAVVGIEDYDLGAPRLKARVMGNQAAPAFSSSDAKAWTCTDESVNEVLSALLGPQSRIADKLVTPHQLHWIANRPLSVFGEMAGPVYEELIRIGEQAMIPIDNRVYVFGEPVPSTLRM